MYKWIAICAEYDSLSDEQRSKLSFDEFIVQMGYQKDADEVGYVKGE